MAATDLPCCEPMFWLYLVISVALVAFAGLMSGLTLGLMSLSLVDLEVLAKAGLPQDKKNAEKILPIVKNQHLLLCTLLIGNSLAMEALPVFLDDLLPAWGAILISVTLILAFGEIIPQAVCTKYGLSVGAKLSVVVRLLVIILFPLSYPISKLLDWVLGKRHTALLRRAELKTLVDMHGNEAGKGGELTRDETTIIAGVLDMTQKTAKDAMTSISNIFSLDMNSKLDEKTMELLIKKGHSRVPIYSGNPSNIVGLILVKNLIKCRAEDETPLRDLTIRRIPVVHDCFPLYDILNQFQKGHSHMAVVVKSKKDFKEAVENGMTEPSMFKIKISSTSEKSEAEIKGMEHQVYLHEHLNVYSETPSAYSSDTESLSMNYDAMQNQLCPHNKLDKEDENISRDDFESLHNSDEEVIGVITLEDVMEELLQEEILDETDEHVDVHKRTKINLLLRSPGAELPFHLQWQTPVASPLPSYHDTPISSYSHSPISPSLKSQFSRPSLLAFPKISIPNSPVGFGGGARC